MQQPACKCIFAEISAGSFVKVWNLMRRITAVFKHKFFMNMIVSQQQFAAGNRTRIVFSLFMMPFNLSLMSPIERI